MLGLGLNPGMLDMLGIVELSGRLGYQGKPDKLDIQVVHRLGWRSRK